MPGAGRIIRRPEKKEFNSADLAQFGDVASACHRFDQRHHQHMVIGLLRVLEQGLSPTRSTFAADATHAFRRKLGELHRLPELLGSLDPRNDDAVRADVQRAFDKAGVKLGQADQRDGVAARRGLKVVQDVLPIEVPVLGVNNNPVHPERNGYF